ncbi:MAG: selenium-binding family protein [Gemmatimonadetes bacterium]|nr:selenium-binding family protein [Gemmatimonadota bacterium]
MKTRILGPLLAASLLLPSACARPADRPSTDGTGLLYVWAADADAKDPDFLAVLDARSGSSTYGSILSTVTVSGRANVPHHTEYALTPGAGLWANGWSTGKTFMFDLTAPLAPRVSGEFGARGGYAYPHSYARLPNGSVLATFQSSGEGYTATGGLVELDARGELVRSASGISPEVARDLNWTYSLLVLPDLDRVVVTNTRMGMVAEWESMAKAAMDSSHHHVSQDVRTTHIQIFRLSDLALLHTLQLPPQGGGHDAWTAEPRRLANGDVYVNTFSCGLYRVVGVATERPSVTPTLFSPVSDMGSCAVPVVLGNYWIQPSTDERMVVAYDLSDPAKPREASRLVFDSTMSSPHWLALDPAQPRLVVTFGDHGVVVIVDIDPTTGKLTLDERFRDAGAATPGVRTDRAAWPHGATGAAKAHGAVFGTASRP